MPEITLLNSTYDSVLEDKGETFLILAEMTEDNLRIFGEF